LARKESVLRKSYLTEQSRPGTSIVQECLLGACWPISGLILPVFGPFATRGFPERPITEHLRLLAGGYR
jgi:hypothetical protein